MISEKTTYMLSTAGFLMIAVAMVVPLVEGPYYTGTWYQYVYGSGALIMLICSLLSPFKGKDVKLKRLYRIQSWSSIMFCVATFFLFYPGATMRDWVAFTLAGAVIRGYSTIAISNRLRRIAAEAKK